MSITHHCRSCFWNALWNLCYDRFFFVPKIQPKLQIDTANWRHPSGLRLKIAWFGHREAPKMAIFQSSSHPFCSPTPPEQPRADLHQLTWRWKEKISTWKKNEKSTSRRGTTTWIPLPPKKWKSSPSHKVATRAALEPSLVPSMHLKRLEVVGFELASAPIAKRLHQAQGPVRGQVQWRSGLHWDQTLRGIWRSSHSKKRSLARSSNTWPPGSLEHRLSWLSCWSHGHPQLSQHPHPHPSKSSSNATISRGENSNPPTRVGVHSLLILCRIQNLVQNPKSKIRNPKSEIQNPKSEIQNPKSKIRNPKSEIQHPKSKIQNPKSEIRNPKSKIRNPKSKIPRQNSKFGVLGASHKELLHNDPKSNFGFWILDFGFWILDFGFWIPDFRFWRSPGDVPLGHSATVPGGQRLESPLARLWGPVQNQLYLVEQESKLGFRNQGHRK